MEIDAASAACWAGHELCVCGVVCLAAQLVGEVDGEVKAVEAECGAETSLPLWHSAFCRIKENLCHFRISTV